MSVTIDIRCDECVKDLQYTGNCEDYYISIDSQTKLPWFAREGMRGGAVTGMAIEPVIPKQMTFCDLKCLRAWISKIPEDARRVRV
jgi:hypothetical protein